MIVLRAIFFEIAKRKKSDGARSGEWRMRRHLQRILFEECQYHFCRVKICVVGMNNQFSVGPSGLRLTPSYKRLKYGKHVVPGVKFLPFWKHVNDMEF
jgi:hypothetical protein